MLPRSNPNLQHPLSLASSAEGDSNGGPSRGTSESFMALFQGARPSAGDRFQGRSMGRGHPKGLEFSSGYKVKLFLTM